jgi:octaprenyl-diphosphate synthase
MTIELDPSPDLRTHGDEVLGHLARTTRSHGIDPLAARMEALGAALAADVSEVDRTLGALAEARGDLAERAAGHLLAHPGKRIRASCALLAARLGPRSAPTAVREVAMAAELVHAATLLHDDVIDEGTERRGVPASRVVYGNSASILGGDHLLVEALRRVERVEQPLVLSELLGTISEMVSAEAFQLERRGDRVRLLGDTPEARQAAYLRIAQGKTAALFRWALRSGARLSGMAPAHVTAIGAFGESLGLAFQLVDDALDLDGDPAATGKNALADLREGKLTWPLMVALERDPGLAEALSTSVEDPRELVSLAQRIRETGAAEATRAAAAEHVKAGLAELERLPDSPARRAFAALVESAAARAR